MRGRVSGAVRRGAVRVPGRLVSVSEIIRCHFCPVRFSLERKLEIQESPRYTIAKQVSSHLGGDLDESAIWEEVEAILPEIDQSFRAYLNESVERCRRVVPGGSLRRPMFPCVRTGSGYEASSIRSS